MIQQLVLLAGWLASGYSAGSNPAQDSVWYALPPGFDQSRPDSILGLVEQAPLWFDGMYLFGDSDCDTGNLFKLTKNTDPDPKAYWKGRFSNGPMWPDYLQARHNLNVRNYAYGGAVVDRKNTVVLDVPDFQKQLATHKSSPALECKKPIVFIQFVGNDLLNKTVTPDQLASEVGVLMQKLIDLGELKDFFVMLSPIVAYDNQGLNTALVAMTDSLAKANKDTAQIKTLSMMDLYSSMSAVAPVTADPSIWRVSEDYCYNRDSKETCSDPENHFRFDMFHPSTVPNYNTAMYISDAISRFWPL